MTEILNIIKNSGFSDLFLFACLSFFLAKFVLSQDWYKEHLNGLRDAIAWTFYWFGLILLIVTILTLPQCDQIKNKQTNNENIVNDRKAVSDTDSDANTNKQE